jgi:hypothetical protein
MATDTSTPPSGKPRPWLLVGLGAAVVLALLTTFMTGKSATPVAHPSNPRAAARAKNVDNVQPGDLVVHLEALKGQKPAAESNDRNPFRFYVKPPPPPPPPREGGPGGGPTTTVTTTIPGPPPPPPITLKYIGLLEGVPGLGNVAVFSDCRTTMRAREGEIIAGQYRLVRIGKESVVLEYADGRGTPTTIRQSGQECVGK